jgi:3-hydroxy-9,10-secoandrosta-1,3,5(10)-triene-9,17-dione monooxygenase reductase component
VPSVPINGTDRGQGSDPAVTAPPGDPLPVTGTGSEPEPGGAPTVRVMSTSEQVKQHRQDREQVPAPTPTELRRAMGTFASGVTVVTGMDGDEAVGFACQSFASVSLEPPLVLFCADHRGKAWPRIRTSGRFTVNVLGEEQHEVCGRFGSARGAKYDGLDWDVSRWGTPALPDVLLRVHCEVHDVHVAGDHDVVIGRVLEVENCGDARPMIFFRGRFGVDPEPEFAPPDWGWGDRWG